MGEYTNILHGLPVMCLLVVGAMIVVFGAMCMDAVFGWRKAKERGEARTSYLFSRSVNKFLLYEGAMFIAGGIDTLIHFAWMQFTTSVHWCPFVSILIGVVLCVVEIWSMHEKAEAKTRKNITHAIEVVADALSKEQAIEIAKHIIDKTANKDETEG